MSQPGTPDVSPPTSSEVSTSGRVKWFNNKAGYGFITVSSGEQEGSDVFVHHSAITVGQEQYRYLVQGEYVNFQLCQVDDDNHKWQAGDVKGINNGKLMCETRLESRESRMNRNPTSDGGGEGDRRPARGGQYREENPTHYRVRTRGQGPRDGDEWMLVRRRAPRQGGGSSPSREVLRSRQSKPTTGGGNH
jgi:cold shock CspA family protein